MTAAYRNVPYHLDGPYGPAHVAGPFGQLSWECCPTHEISKFLRLIARSSDTAEHHMIYPDNLDLCAPFY